jgi:gluconate 2-dehydrogenase alpha chain
VADEISHPSVDVVVLGLGPVGGHVATELAVSGYTVVGIEKGPYWDYGTDWHPSSSHDEWGIAVERKFDTPSLEINTFTLRNNRDQFALPVRRNTRLGQITSLGHGVGGAAAHFGAVMGRFGPWPFKAYSETVNKYGAGRLPSNHDMEDWPITYDDAKPYYEAWENAMGISGDTEGPFHPDVKYPNPPHPQTPVADLFNGAAESLGYHPYPMPSAIASASSMNQYGVKRNACIYCGWCGGFCNFPCEQGAKSSSHVTAIPAALETGRFDMRLFSYVYRIDVGSDGKATGVRYLDARGDVNIQPAKTVFAGLWGPIIYRLMSLSGIGRPYNPVTGSGSLGRGVHSGHSPGVTGVSGTLDIGGNAYSVGNAYAGASSMLDLAEDNFDHTDLDFIGGANLRIGSYPGGAPNLLTGNPPGKNNFGSAWKASIKDSKLLTKIRVGASPAGVTIPRKDHFWDLDPHYTDMYGDPLVRWTLDWDENQWRAADYIAPKIGEIFTKMGATDVSVNKVPESSQNMDYWGYHTRGGIRMGNNPTTSVFNKWLQCWDAENVFAASEGTDTFGDNTTPGTHIAGMQAFLAADGVKKYLESPGSLA